MCGVNGTLSFFSSKAANGNSTSEWESAQRFRPPLRPGWKNWVWIALHLYVVVSQRLARGPESRLKLELTSPKSKSNKSHIFIGHWSPGQALCRRQHNHGRHADSWRPSDCSLQLLLASKAEMCRTWSIATDSSLGPVCHPNTATTDWPL